jgi:hypothetical protein
MAYVLDDLMTAATTAPRLPLSRTAVGHCCGAEAAAENWGGEFGPRLGELLDGHIGRPRTGLESVPRRSPTLTDPEGAGNCQAPLCPLRGGAQLRAGTFSAADPTAIGRAGWPMMGFSEVTWASRRGLGSRF